MIAAVEGVMPQTREHRAILEELGITRGILVVNKCDLADRRQLDLMKGEIRREFRGTCFEKAPSGRGQRPYGPGNPAAAGNDTESGGPDSGERRERRRLASR